MSKIKRKAFTLLMMFSLSTIALWSAPVYMASEIEKNINEYTNEELLNMTPEELEEFSQQYSEDLVNGVTKTPRLAPLVAAVLAAAAKIFGGAALATVSYVISRVGVRAACSKYNDANKVWDYVCDATNQYAD
jgi:hypothetical protein